MTRSLPNAVMNTFYSVSERIVLIGTLLTMIVGLVIWMPYGPGHPDVEILGM